MHQLLVIEDNPADIEIIRILLEDFGFKHELYSAESLADGFKIIQEKKIDIVLLDLTLQDSIGFSTLKSYVQEASRTPVIVLTGNSNVALGDQSVKAGAQDYLVKGEFDSKRLVDSIRYSLQRFRTQAALQDKVSKLSSTESRFREVQQMAQMGDWDMDIVSNSMTWSEEMFRILGITPFTIQPVLSEYLEKIHPEDRTAVEDFFNESIKTGEQGQMEHRLLIDSRIVKHIVLQAKLNFDDIANKILLIGNIQDISQHKKQEEQQNIEPISTNLDSDFLADIGFNLRIPLHTIVQLVANLEKNRSNPAQKETIHGIRIGLEDLSLQINDLLVFVYNQAETLKSKEVEVLLAYFLQRVEDVLRFHTQTAGVKLKFKRTTEIPELIRIDFPKATQLIYNLMASILQFIALNTELLIQVGIKKMGEQKGILHFSIEYDGRSIWEEKTPKTPLPFERNHKYFLEAAERLIAPLNAQWNFLVKGPDTHFVELNIPFSIINQEKNKVNFDRPIRILLIEDHALYQMVIKNMLLGLSDLVTVIIAASGAEAISTIGHRSFDLVVLDLHMPDMDGIETGLAIKKISPIPIVAISAHPSRQEELSCRELGFSAYLPKPLNPELLGQTLMEVMQKAF